MSTPSSPLSLDAKTKFQQLWAQFGTAFMEEPMLRDHSKRVEDLVRENERLRLEISSTKAEQTKQSSEHKLTAEELENLREEVNHEVKSGIERVQERNVALARKEKEVVVLRREIKGREAIWAQERQKYKHTIRLLRDELESQNVAHERLRKNVAVLTGDYDASGDEYDEEEEEELANQAELQLQAERSLQAGASYRRASRRLQVEETPGVEEANNTGEPEEEEEEYEYYEVENGQGEEGEEAELGGDEEEEDEDEEAEDEEAEEEGDAERDENDAEPEEEEAEVPEEQQAEEPEEEQPLRRSTRIRHSEAAAVVEPINGNETVELIGTKRGRDQSSDMATVDGANGASDRQAEYNGVPPTQAEATEASDSAERPAKRTRRQTERYSNALESNKNFAKIMTPPATSPPFLPSVLPRRRSPARKPTTLSQTSTPVNRRGPKRGAAAAAAAAQAAVQPSPASAPPKVKATQTTKSPAKAPAKSPAKVSAKTPSKGAKSPAKSNKSPRVAKKTPQKSPWAAYPKKMFDFTLISGFKHGRSLLVDDEKIREQMQGLLPKTTERIREVAVTPGFWRSYAHKRNLQRKEQGLSPHCAFTSQYPLGSEEVETENQWVDGEDFACSNCLREGIVCFTVGERLDTEKYGAVYRPPKRS
ncbi:hypothetical protein TWF106_000287 [Orbilia oligospora]|uniref:Uncharacterized protein n=1 Tax=Orbilia oligospora TaxID=2813651 RepID=A0A7C8Q082_ORBOL|nr:hypothetical protein TWF788_003929 [Orbilia oligospora]KAF3217686.1 hypothetical protein TWF679_001888 [Orbilia oligospora]KAF3226546.1 hypothetical protein TWF106_000287 [Orbilia oligospora]